MELKSKSLLQCVVCMFLIGNIVVASPNNVYSVLEKLTEITITYVDMAKNNLTTQLSMSGPLNTSNVYYNFGVSPCWNMSLNESERLDDDYVRLKTLQRHANALNISKKNYVTSNIAKEMGNLCRSIVYEKTALGYPGCTRVPRQSIKAFNAKTRRQAMIIDLQFLTTLQKNLHLIRQDFAQKISTKNV